jgi:amidase
LESRFFGYEAIPSAEFTAKLTKLDRLRSGLISFLEKYDVVICPVNAYPAMSHETALDQSDGWTYTRVFNLTGWPVSVVRGGTSPEGLPIGVQIVTRPWREDAALAVASHIETALGGWQRPLL